MKKKIPGWATFLIVFFLFLTAGLAGFATYLVLKQKWEKLQEPDNNTPIVYNKKNSAAEYSEGISIKNEFLEIEEYPYAIDYDNNPKYFFGIEGLELLSREFHKRAWYGPEIIEIPKITINKKFTNVNTNQVNGFYTPDSKEIALFTTEIVRDKNGNIRKVDNLRNDIKVEMVLPTLVHEYTHHIANVYNNSGKLSDPNYSNELDYKLSTNIHYIATYANNIKFLKEFKSSLFYDETYKPITNLPNWDIGNKSIFSYPNSLYKSFSARELFNYANYTNIENPEKWNSLNTTEYTFNNTYESPIKFSEPVESGKIEYLYSFEELIPREFMKMIYSTSKRIAKSSTNPNGILYFDKVDDYGHNYGIHLTAYGEDSLRNLAFKPKSLNSYNVKIAAPNWVFDDQLRQFKNIYGQQIYPEAESNVQLKKFYKTFLDLFGYGQTISYMGYKTIFNNKTKNSDYENIRLGGYLSNNGIDSKNNVYLTYEVGTKTKNIKLNLFNTNFTTKTKWNSFSEDRKYNPSILNKPSSMYAYYSNLINIQDIKKSLIGDKEFKYFIWQDKNNNGDYDADEKVNINLKKEFDIQNEIQRSIINSRKSFEIQKNTKALFNSHILKLNYEKTTDSLGQEIDNYYYSFVKY
ncbi:MYPU_1760 family metalloprotease [Metamycoplasma hyosynoviae]|uniref:MYPU_1760 family metalloprotease n=1 Tax=Metamycoplasma hyosynoviae TaxID=29559 RepID=UPI002366E87E|nr:hypothetical protein [Metamycoplasma hyosynoviae]MDD7912594.1 hypothetical protein [Metamycoplasma hyosynoviae]